VLWNANEWVRAGIADLQEQQDAPPEVPARRQRVRRPGAGRPPVAVVDTTLMADLDSLVEPVSRGDPESPLRWTCKSKDKLAAELVTMGHRVSATTVGRLLHEMGYSLQVVVSVRRNASPRQAPAGLNFSRGCRG
jgi:hypothetical protein